MRDESSSVEFDLVYRSADVYREVLPAYLFGGEEDVDLVARLLGDTRGQPDVVGRCRVLELGCGPGRMTRVLAPHASELQVVDNSEDMLQTLRRDLPGAATTCADIRVALRDLVAGGSRFDVVGSFWSLNYPLLSCFEHVTAQGVTPVPDQDGGRRLAERTVADLVDVLAPGGHLVVLFFDAGSPEQRFVTRLWERVAPFPGSGRDVTWRVLLDVLRSAADSGIGHLSHERRAGQAVSRSVADACRWFALGHLNGLPALIRDRGVRAEIAAFVDAYRRPDGAVAIPASVQVVHFRRSPV